MKEFKDNVSFKPVEHGTRYRIRNRDKVRTLDVLKPQNRQDD